MGWGIQFQNPAFLMVMMVMLGIFALSLLDLVIIPVPRFAQRLAGISGHSARHGYSGDFLAGMLATILATPCSAPFVGTAVAVALSGTLADLFGIFMALGVGLAAPWLLVAAQPSLVGFFRVQVLDALAETWTGDPSCGNDGVAWQCSGVRDDRPDNDRGKRYAMGGLEPGGA